MSCIGYAYRLSSRSGKCPNVSYHLFCSLQALSERSSFGKGAFQDHPQSTIISLFDALPSAGASQVPCGQSNDNIMEANETTTGKMMISGDVLARDRGLTCDATSQTEVEMVTRKQAEDITRQMQKQLLDQAKLFEDMQARLCRLEGDTCHAASSSNSLNPTNEPEEEEIKPNPAPTVSVPVKPDAENDRAVRLRALSERLMVERVENLTKRRLERRSAGGSQH